MGVAGGCDQEQGGFESPWLVTSGCDGVVGRFIAVCGPDGDLAASVADMSVAHGVGSHASGFYAMLVLISGIDAQWPPLADAVPN